MYIYDLSYIFRKLFSETAAKILSYPETQKDVTILPVEQWQGGFEKHVKLYVTERVVCYCNVCTTSAKKGWARVYHLAELIF